MNVSKPEFDRAATRLALPPTQAKALWHELQAGAPAATSRFDVVHLAYYFGAVLVLGAMGWFMSNAWEAFGGAGICVIAVAYALGFAVAGGLVWQRLPAWRTPAGLLVTLSIGMTPLAVYGLERWVGWWPAEDPGNYSGFHVWVRGGWIVMELATVLAGAVALRFVRFPFLTAPVAFALWYLSMDLTPMIFGREAFGWDERAQVSLAFGALMLTLAYLVDFRRRWAGLDYGFWLSLFGLMAFWGGLTMLNSNSEWGALGYGVINVVLMLLGVLLDRRAFTIFGALGVFGYVGHLAWSLFADTPLFPFALSAFGLLVIVCGVLYQRQRAALRQAILQAVPAGWLRLLPQRDFSG